MRPRTLQELHLLAVYLSRRVLAQKDPRDHPWYPLLVEVSHQISARIDLLLGEDKTHDGE